VSTDLSPLSWLFSESQSRFVVTLHEKELEPLRGLADARKVPMQVLGRTGGSSLTINDWIDLPVAAMRAAREDALAEMLKG